jgi:sporulation protein YlmC with PRC-barrel domain
MMVAATEYPKHLFNKGVRTQDGKHIGHVTKGTGDTIVIFGKRRFRFDVPKSTIIAVGRNVILRMNYAGVFRYRVDRNAPLPQQDLFAS